MAVTERTLAMQRDLRNRIAAITDNHTRVLVAAWVDAWNEIHPDLTDALLDQLTLGPSVTKAQLLRSTRLRKALAVVANRLEDLARDAGVTLTGSLREVVDTAGHAQASVIDSQLPPGTNMVAIDQWSRVDERAIDAIVQRSTKQITSRLKPLPRETYQVVRRELIRGVASGSNPRETARRMVARAEGRFNGQLGLTRALVISRTETLDAHRQAALVGRLEHADMLRGWEWLATLDGRTCPSCWAKHGSIHPTDERGPDDHHQGRCAAVPLTKSWADLGFDVPEPPSVTPDAAATFARLGENTQRKILGPARFAAWQEGRFPMDDWTVLRKTDGWRDAWHVAPAPKPQSVGRSGGRAA